MLLIAGCGPYQIKMDPQYRPKNQDIYMLIGNDKVAEVFTLYSAVHHPNFTQSDVPQRSDTLKRGQRIIKATGIPRLFVKAVNSEMSSSVFSYKVLTNVQVNSVNSPRLKVKNKFAIDRDFSKLKSKLTSDLVLEFRLEIMDFTQRGLGGDCSAQAIVTGILIDLKANKKVWQKTMTHQVSLGRLSLEYTQNASVNYIKKKFYESIATTVGMLISKVMISGVK